MMIRTRLMPWPLVAALATAACVSTTSYERGALTRIESDAPGQVLARVHGPGAVTATTPRNTPRNTPRDTPHDTIDGSLDGYVAYAMAQNPGLLASYEEWRAATYAIEERRRLPDPMLSYGVFLRRVETRVGPQRQRFGVQQRIPWPTKRRTAAAAAADMASAAERRFEAQALSIVRRVAEAYWRLWAIQQVRDIETEQRELLAALAEAARTRLALGKASLADVTQIDLEVARRADALSGLVQRELSAKAMLRQAIGAPATLELLMTAPTPLAVVPAESDATLRQEAKTQPRIAALTAMARASEHAAEAANAQGMPDFTLGADYIDTGAATHNPDVADSGKDPIMVSIAVSVPLWRGSYDAAENKSRAEAAAYRARQREAENMAEAEVDVALADVRDAARRIAVYESTLIPQAESAYAAVVGSYQTGASQFASTLIAQKNVLELHNLLVQARADHARAWSRLEEITGRPVAAQPMNREVTP